jgi:uncharacterized protein YcbX
MNASQTPTLQHLGLPPGSSIGRVAELWRYPVKSMLGEQCESVAITAAGVLGDRAWALREIDTGRIVSAKKYPQLLEFRAVYEAEPAAGVAGCVRIDPPEGGSVYADHPDASRRLSSILGLPLRLERHPRPSEKTTIDRANVFGDVPVSDIKPEWTPDTMPDHFQLMSSSFKEIGALFLVTSGSIEHLRKLQGGTARIDRRRFRPNIYVESESAGEFVEDGWLGSDLCVGEQVQLTELSPTLWCVTSTLAQEELPRDLSILRTAAQHHKGCLGVYASVASDGRVDVGSRISTALAG